VKPDLSVSIAGLTLDNPIMTASGCGGYGEELSQVFPLSRLGALVTKSITLEPRMGHPPPRTAETASGMLNAIGLANVGIDRFMAEKIPFLEKQNTRVIVNVAGSTQAEYVEVCARLNDCPRVDMVELNISCPHVDAGGMEFGTDPAITEHLVSEVRKVFTRPVIAKLTPNVTDIGAVARHMDDVVCINRRIHVHQRPPIGRLNLESTFGCAVEYLFHGEIPHRVVKTHDD